MDHDYCCCCCCCSCCCSFPFDSHHPISRAHNNCCPILKKENINILYYQKKCNFTITKMMQWIPVNRDQFLQPKKSRLTENPLYPKLFMYCYLVNGFLKYIPINRKSPLSESRLTEIHCNLLQICLFFVTDLLSVQIQEVR